MPRREALARDLAGQAEYRRVGGIGGAERGSRVQHTRTRDHAVGTGVAGRPRMTEGHVGGALLVAAADEADAVAGPVHRVEKMIELPAGQAIDGVHVPFARIWPSSASAPLISCMICRSKFCRSEFCRSEFCRSK